jgi:protein arginine kinase
MHLPGLVLTKAVEGVLQAASQMGMCARGFLGEHSQIVGSFFQISNQATMGATEAEYLKSTEALVRHVVSLEREAREKLLAHARGELADKVYRSFGILRYARSLSVAEFLNLSSALRIGIDTEILKGIATVDINRLMLVALPAHIQTLYDRSMDEGELAAMRAEIVRTFLKQKLGDL